MTPSEIVEFTRVVKLLWPHWRDPSSRDEIRALVTIWRPLLDDVPPDIAVAVVQQLAADGREHPPPVGVIRDRAIDMAAAARGDIVPDPDQAWAEVQEAIRAGGYQQPPDHWSHPVVTSTVRTITWSQLCLSTNQETTRAHFLHSYRDAKARYHAERGRLPSTLQILAAQPPAIEA